MLVLTRRDGESLFIGDDTEVTVLNVDGNYVKTGITVPDDVTILREELYHQGNNAEASRQDVNAMWREVLSQPSEMNL